MLSPRRLTANLSIYLYIYISIYLYIYISIYQTFVPIISLDLFIPTKFLFYKIISLYSRSVNPLPVVGEQPGPRRQRAGQDQTLDPGRPHHLKAQRLLPCRRVEDSTLCGSLIQNEF